MVKKYCVTNIFSNEKVNNSHTVKYIDNDQVFNLHNLATIYKINILISTYYLLHLNKQSSITVTS